MRHSFPFFCIEEFNPYHKIQWKSQLSPFQWNYLRSSFEEQKCTRYISGKVCFDISSSYVLRLQIRVSDFFSFVLFRRKNAFIRFPEEMRLISPAWWRLPQKSRLKVKILKNWDTILITMTLISSCHWKTLAPFACERKDLKTYF